MSQCMGRRRYGCGRRGMTQSTHSRRPLQAVAWTFASGEVGMKLAGMVLYKHTSPRLFEVTR